jgi:hypothetical protein
MNFLDAPRGRSEMKAAVGLYANLLQREIPGRTRLQTAGSMRHDIQMLSYEETSGGEL